MGESYAIAALVYTELNPVRARMVRRPDEYLWSSARAHLAGRDRSGFLDMGWWNQNGLGEDWKLRLDAGVEEGVVSRLRSALVRGSPCGSKAFVKRIEERTGVRFRGDRHE